jgi:branched-chain amino acid transport system permease protein
MAFDTVVLFLVSGAVFGSILALLSSGYSLVYGVGGIINLAHGAFYLLTAYMIFWFVDGAILSYPLAIIVSLTLITIIGAISYYILIKPTHKHSEIAVMIVTFALAFFIEQGILMYEGAKVGELQAITLDPLIPGNFRFFGALISYQDLLILIVALSLLTLLILFIKKTKLGKSIRAVAQDKDAARLMGINVHRILMITVAFSALLAGCAAMLYVPQTVVVPYDGWFYLLLAMSVVILGGMGSLPGSVIGAFIIAYARSFTFYFVDLEYGYQFTGIIHLAIILLVLIIRPRGLLGKKQRL